MFLTVFTFIKGSKVAQYVLLGLLVVSLYGAWVLHERSVGKGQGKEQEKQVEVKSVGEDVKQASAKFDSDLTASKQRETQLIDAANKSAGAARDAMATAQNLQHQADVLRQQLAARSDLDLHGDTVSTLGLRRPGEVQACYTVPEERAINDVVHQGPVCQARAAQQDAALTAQGDQVTKLLARVDELLARDQRRADYTGKLQAAVVQLYGLHPPKVRSLKCLRMWHCGEGQLKLPTLDPTILKGE